MKHIGKTSRAVLAISLAIAGSQVPQMLHAGDRDYAAAADISPGLSLSSLATQAISTNPRQAKSAIDQLRKAGPAGLDALFTAYQPQITAHRNGTNVFRSNPADKESWPRITAALDAVAAQHDAYASGLYWYTDFPSAQAAAKASGKPILSLRLLGNLSDEYSCANSRFFRTVLYANTDVAKHLRENFILHWQSVRPDPVITIDFGDGRIIRRTITGNSIHYVLTADGTVVDAIPGLYGPKAFLRELDEAEKGFGKLSGRTIEQQAMILERYHSDLVASIGSAYRDDFNKAGITLIPSVVQAQIQNASAAPTARVAAFRAVSKSGVERPTVAALDTSAYVGMMDDKDWSRVAALHSEDATLDQSSHALMEAKTVDAVTAARRAMSKMRVEDPLVKTIANFQRSIAEDTVRNEYLFHLQIHRWLADPATASLANDVNTLNKKVYAELFLTPDSDPWLGLVPADTYTALDGGGVCVP